MGAWGDFWNGVGGYNTGTTAGDIGGLAGDAALAAPFLPTAPLVGGIRMSNGNSPVSLPGGAGSAANNAFHNLGDAIQGKTNFRYQTYQPQMQAAQSAGVNVGPAAQGRGMVQGSMGAQGALMNGGPQDQARAYQNSLMQQLQAQANGQGPSLAQGMLHQGMDQAARQQMGLLASNRNNPLAALQASQNLGQNGQALAQQAAQQRMQEQLNAQGMLGQMAGQMRGQDLDFAGQNAQLGMQNAQMSQQNNQFNAGQFNGMLGQDMGAQNAMAQLQAQLSQQNNQYNAGQSNQMSEAYNQMMLQQMMQQNAINGGFSGDYQKALLGVMNPSTALQGAGAAASGAAALLPAVAGLSDERQKTDIAPGQKSLQEFLDALEAHEYAYKDPTLPGTSEGRHTSVMAQELEKSAIGKRMVVETEHGKMVDYGKGLPAMLAALADLHKRTAELEKQGGQ
jgi:hypothetical protein